MKRKGGWRRVQDGLVVLAAVLVLLPIVWIALAAFKTSVDVFQLKLFFSPTLENFATIFEAPYLIHQKLHLHFAVSYYQAERSS